MAKCKRCGSDYIVKIRKTTIEEFFYPGSEFPDKFRRKVITIFKCKDCGSKNSKVEKY